MKLLTNLPKGTRTTRENISFNLDEWLAGLQLFASSAQRSWLIRILAVMLSSPALTRLAMPGTCVDILALLIRPH
jgi:hypothetical protein